MGSCSPTLLEISSSVVPLTMMNIRVKIHELNAEDPLEENTRKPLTLPMSPDSTFGDLKHQIEEEEEFEPEEQQLLVGFCPVEDMNMKLQDAVEEGDTVTAIIARPDTNELLTATNLSNKTITLIVGSREKFDVIPFKNETRIFTNSIFKKFHNFGIVTHERGEDGYRIFTCNVYQLTDGSKVEIRGDSQEVQVFEHIGNLPVPVQVKKEKVFKESDLIKGFLTQNMKDALAVVTPFLGPIATVGGAAVGGI